MRLAKDTWQLDRVVGEAPGCETLRLIQRLAKLCLTCGVRCGESHRHCVDQFAMAEDIRGNSFVLRRGDRVMNGFVEGLKRDAMIVNITVDGQSQSVSIPVTRKGERTNASR